MASNLSSFGIKGEFLLSPWLKLPSAQNNPHITEAHFGVTSSELPLKIPWQFHIPEVELVDCSDTSH